MSTFQASLRLLIGDGVEDLGLEVTDMHVRDASPDEGPQDWRGQEN